MSSTSTKNKKKFSMSLKQFHRYKLCIEMLDHIFHIPSFRDCIETTFDGEVDTKELLDLLSIFEDVIREERKGNKEEKGEIDYQKFHFSASYPSTTEVIELFNKVDTTGLKLRYDQVNNSCPADVDKLFRKYCDQHGLKDIENKVFKIDDFLRQFSPILLGNINEIPFRDRSTIGKVTNGWCKKNK